jgi:hypothetical protein
MGIFSSIKDNLSSFSGEQIVKKAVEQYGELQDFRISSSTKTMFLKILLMGETKPVEINVKRYAVTDEHGSTYLRIYEIETSREWMTRLAKEFIINQKFEVPSQYSSMIKKFL